MATSPDDIEDDLQPEYDFRAVLGVVRGKCSTGNRERLRVIRLAEDVAKACADEAAVKEALREYLRPGNNSTATRDLPLWTKCKLSE